jgi:hypothetical protein
MYEWLIQEIVVQLGLPGAWEGLNNSTVLFITGFAATCLQRPLQARSSGYAGN